MHSAHFLSIRSKEHSHGACGTMLNRGRGEDTPDEESQWCLKDGILFLKSMRMNPSGTKDLVRIYQLRRNSSEVLVFIAVL